MLIYNVKLNKNLIFKLSILIMLIIGIFIAIIAIYNFYIIFQNKEDYNLIDDSYPASEYAILTSENYTNILQEVHSDIDTYVGQKISFSGYIYRANDFTDDQFVLARDMDIGNNQTLIVGFLCSCENATDFQSYTWINIKGEIIKGEYNDCDIPIIKINEIEEINRPENSTVSLPDDEYVPTAVIY